MLNIFLKIYDSIFPPHPSLLKIRSENKESILRFLQPKLVKTNVALADFNISMVRAVITANKFHNSKHASKLLGAILEKWLSLLPHTDINTALVPIPLSEKRKRERGYNQVTRILHEVKLSNFATIEILKRKKHTAPQTSLVKTERQKNVKDAFIYKNKIDLSGFKRIIIVDDVVTTGSTLSEAKKALIQHLSNDCEIICLAIAH